MIDVDLQAADARPEPDPAATAHLLGVVNEALSNVARHSGATMASVSLEPDGPTGALLLDDRGQRPRVRRGPSACSATRGWSTCAPG